MLRIFEKIVKLKFTSAAKQCGVLHMQCSGDMTHFIFPPEDGITGSSGNGVSWTYVCVYLEGTKHIN